MPILLDHLPRPYPQRVRAGIAQALTTPGASEHWDRLVELYRAEPSGTEAKDGLANALAKVADRRTIVEVAELAADPAHGLSRVLLLRRIARFKITRAQLDDLASDPELRTEIDAIVPARARAIGSVGTSSDASVF